MNTEFFIARTIAGNRDKNNVSGGIVKIAIIAIAVSIIVMIFSISIITGFKSEIWSKIIGFGSHITITNQDANESYETIPIKKNQKFYPKITEQKGIKHIQPFAIKAGIIKTETDIQGVILKGVGNDYDWSFFEQNIVDGSHFKVTEGEKTNKVLISKYLSDLLKLKVNDFFFMYFIQKPPQQPRLRKYYISGIYNTGMEEFDKLFVIADIADVQKLNDWTNNQITGFEILIDDFNDLDQMNQLVQNKVGYGFQDDGSMLEISSIKENYSQIFDWLSLIDMNVQVILIIMIFVAFINMAVALLIIILENANMIGLLKALGTTNWSIQKIFLYHSFFIIGKGLLWGNIIGITLALIQKHTGIIALDPASYYVDKVPINLDILHLVMLNTGTIFVTLLLLIIPSLVISRIDPIKTIRFN